MEVKINMREFEKLMRKLDAPTKDTVIHRSLLLGSQHIAGWVKKYRLTGPRPKYLGVRSERLRSSITGGRVKKLGTSYTATIGTNVKYARKHEYGIGIKARPFLRPALKAKNNIIFVIETLRKKINQAIARA